MLWPLAGSGSPGFTVMVSPNGREVGEYVADELVLRKRPRHPWAGLRKNGTGGADTGIGPAPYRPARSPGARTTSADPGRHEVFLGTSLMGERRRRPGESERKATARMTTRVHETPQGRIDSSGDEPLRLQERVEKRAYELWLTGGCRHGNDVGDWLQAEREVLEQRAEASACPGAGEGPITPSV